MELAGKIVVVTGGAHGIGRALVERFEREGARAIGVDIAGPGKRVDVSDGKAVAALVEEVERDIGPIDLFCSNAGILPIDADPNNAASTPDLEWNRAWAVNVMAHVYAARALVPRMIARGGGALLQTASAAGLMSQIGSATYAVSKHAAVAFAEYLSITYGDRGLYVAALCPQAVRTAMLGDLEDGGVAGVDGVVEPEHVAEVVIEGLRAERFLILPHPKVEEYLRRKTADYERWLRGMRRLQERFGGG